MSGMVFIMRQPQMNRWLKFNLVGAIGIVVQLSTLSVLALWLHVHYLVATGLAVEAAILHNFLWHRSFTWADRARSGSEKKLDTIHAIQSHNRIGLNHGQCVAHALLCWCIGIELPAWQSAHDRKLFCKLPDY